MRFLCDGINLEVDQVDSGQPVLLIHGFTGAGVTMRPLATRLDGHKIMPDLIGHGKSEAPAQLSPYTLPSMSKQLSALLHQLGTERAAVVGYSFGGRIALNFALSHPHHVESLTLIGASPGIYDDDAREQRRLADLQLANSISQNGLRFFIEKWLSMPMWESLREHLTREQLENSIIQRLSSHPLGLANSLRAGGTGNMAPLHDQIADIAFPTLLVTGDRDLKFLNIAREMLKDLQKGSLKVIQGAGHATHIERLDETAEVINRHLSCK